MSVIKTMQYEFAHTQQLFGFETVFFSDTFLVRMYLKNEQTNVLISDTVQFQTFTVILAILCEII